MDSPDTMVVGMIAHVSLHQYYEQAPLSNPCARRPFRIPIQINLLRKILGIKAQDLLNGLNRKPVKFVQEGLTKLSIKRTWGFMVK
jgi:hypothetical protein